MEITAQLDEETVHKLQQIQQQTNQDQAEILKAAIAAYYDRLHDDQSIVEPQNSQTQKKTPFEAFQELGLVGCIDGDPDSSQNYKTVIDQYLQEKHDQGRL